MLFKYMGSWSESLRRICTKYSWNPSLKSFHVVPNPIGCDSSDKSKLSLHHRVWEKWVYRTKSQDFVVDLSLSDIGLQCFRHLLVCGSLNSAEEATWQHSALDPCPYFLQKWLPLPCVFAGFLLCSLLQHTWEAVSDHSPYILPSGQYFCSNEMWYCQVLDE